ncbi:hypothetical protein DFH28DRAFT_173882 [Melampsora americana]|nr:hypothetical protein DFH28DRAFT_173882 [Melampsora americana]
MTDEFINFILISPHPLSFSQSFHRFSNQFLPDPFNQLIQVHSSLLIICLGTSLAILLGFTLAPHGSYIRFLDGFKGFFELLKHYQFLRGIDFNRIAASVRGEELGFDDHLNMEVKSVNRTIKRTIRELKPTSNQSNQSSSFSSKLNPNDHQPSSIIQTGSHYPGLINSSSNTCFLNAVLQSLASMPHLINYLELINTFQTETQTPVINSLREILLMLNTPKEFKTILRPILVAQALFKHGIETGNHSSLFNSEQQDAQEFFVIMIDAIESEVQSLIRSIRSESIQFGIRKEEEEEEWIESIRKICRSPFRGLMVNRIGCETCGFTSVFRHSVTDHLSLNVPPKISCSLEECLMDYTKLELLEDYICRKCSIIYTKEIILNQLNQISINSTKEKLKNSKKKKVQGLKKDLKSLELMILNDDFESENVIGKVLVERVASLKTTKQTMFSRPPDSLTFHISRSTAYARGVSFKNHCQVKYPEYLNLSSFCTTSILNRSAHLPISSTNPEEKEDQRYWFKLVSVVVHYGSHSFGHYITFRRIGKDWFRISDENVMRSELNEVLGANPFLIMYEKVCEKRIEVQSEVEERQRKGEKEDELVCRRLSWFEI